jgi:Mg-chelatase subunit ChlD
LPDYAVDTKTLKGEFIVRNDLTEIVLIVDRSGSMSDCKDEAQGGINAFIEDQKKAVGEANFTLVQFDTDYEFIHTGKPIKDVVAYALVPRGMTALLDAVGRAVSETGARLAALEEEDRPGVVMVIIVTDGQENASKEFNWNQVQEMIKHQKEKYQWQFLYLGADISTGVRMGIGVNSAAKHEGLYAKAVYGSTSDKVKMMRAANMAGDREVLTSGGIFTFSDEDRASYTKS